MWDTSSVLVFQERETALEEEEEEEGGRRRRIPGILGILGLFGIDGVFQRRSRELKNATVPGWPAPAVRVGKAGRGIPGILRRWVRGDSRDAPERQRIGIEDGAGPVAD